MWVFAFFEGAKGRTGWMVIYPPSIARSRMVRYVATPTSSLSSSSSFSSTARGHATLDSSPASALAPRGAATYPPSTIKQPLIRHLRQLLLDSPPPWREVILGGWSFIHLVHAHHHDTFGIFGNCYEQGLVRAALFQFPSWPLLLFASSSHS